MSDIDSMRHYRVGLFYGIPVYQPLESGKMAYRNPQDGHTMPKQDYTHQNVQPGQLLIGGGSGEHPAIIFYDIEHAVARYLTDNLEQHSLPTEVIEKASAMQPAYQTIEYCDWSNQDHVEFRALCAPFYGRWKDELSFEAWLLLNIGEFVVHVIPNFSPGIKRWREALSELPEPCLCGITFPYGEYGGNGKNRFRVIDESLDV